VPQGWVSSFAMEVARERESSHVLLLLVKQCAVISPQKTVGVQSPERRERLLAMSCFPPEGHCICVLCL